MSAVAGRLVELDQFPPLLRSSGAIGSHHRYMSGLARSLEALGKIRHPSASRLSASLVNPKGQPVRELALRSASLKKGIGTCGSAVTSSG